MQKSKLPSLVILLILTLITVVFWIVFTVYRTYITDDTNVNVPREVLLPLSPTLNESTIEVLESKIYP
ncbi:MAG: hypothetical protein QY322_02835 [bacterium]|nr:MAG: hypothetical protein QY322_02835 [bacterium]